jgi:hypothetical protein
MYGALSCSFANPLFFNGAPMRLSPLALAVSLSLSLSGAALAQAPAVSEPVLRAHLSLLADDLFEGRGTGQRGGDLTVRYLETQAALIGL